LKLTSKPIARVRSPEISAAGDLFPRVHVRGVDILVAVALDFEIFPFLIEANRRSRHDLAGALAIAVCCLEITERLVGAASAPIELHMRYRAGVPEADFQLVLLIRGKGSVD